MKKKLQAIMSGMLAATLLLSACQSSGTATQVSSETAATTADSVLTTGSTATSQSANNSAAPTAASQSAAPTAAASAADSSTSAADASSLTGETEDLDALLTPASGTVKILTSVTGGKDDEEMALFAQQLGQDTGLDVEMEKPADYSTALQQKLAAGDVYDLIYLNAPDQQNLVNQGVLTDLTDRIAQSRILGDTAVVAASEWEQIKIDGKLYASFNKKEVHRLVNLNAAAARSAGIDPDTIEPTLDGYYNVMKAMKAQASATDFYGLSLVLSTVWDLQPWFSSVGLKTGITQDADGNYDVPISSEASKPVWTWLKKLYDEGLLDPDSFTQSSGDMRSKFQEGKVAVFVDWAAWTGLYNVNADGQYPDEFEAVALPGTKTADGDYMLARGDASLWAIPVNASNPDGAFRVLEYFGTQTGGNLLGIGIEGYDWTVENGSITLTDIGQSHGKDHGAPVSLSDSYLTPVAANPGFENAMTYLKYATPELSTDKTNSYKEIAGRYAISMIQGDLSIDEGLQQMRQALKDAGVITVA
ncbi:ABC transporter substrate-binding protein [Oscillospiraceae bacterium HV4-5-C5C]|nr:ABC transporter substrate-binding protein [Oscillospiraceae bacterium HV4-5-C5C]